MIVLKADQGCDKRRAMETKKANGEQTKAATAVIDRAKVEKVLDKVRPSLRADGGNVELVDVSGDTVKLKLVGHCAGCPMSQMTLKMGIERVIKQELPEVKEVVAV